MYVGVLGAFEASVTGEPVRFERRQQRLLLALLALNANVPLPAGRIAELLWDGEPPPTARNQVQVLVSASRKAVRAAGEPDTVISTSALGYASTPRPPRWTCFRSSRTWSGATGRWRPVASTRPVGRCARRCPGGAGARSAI